MIEQPLNLLVLPSVGNIDEIISKFPVNINLTRGNYKDVEFCYKNGKVKVLHKGVDLKNFSFVWLMSLWKTRAIAYAVKIYLDYYNVPHTDTEESASKNSDQLCFALNQIATPDAFFSLDYSQLTCLHSIEDTCGYPMILKDVKGSRGKHSRLVIDRDQLLQVINSLPKHRKFIFQKFIQNDYDWGIMVANGEIVAAEKSFPSKGEFRNNACNGAKEIFVDKDEIPEAVKAMAIAGSELLKLSWSRSDIIICRSTGLPYLLEVNRFPGITNGSDEVEGAFHYLSTELNKYQSDFYG